MTVKVRAYLVDDSAVSRHALRRALSSDPEIEIVGEAASGEEALERIPSAAPDIVLMDVVMPGADGLETTRELMHHYPKPVIVVSDIGTRADTSFEALRAGALEVIGKPSADQLSDEVWLRGFCRKIRMLAEIPVITRYRSYRARPDASPSPAPRPTRPAAGGVELVCLGASTGGPPALRTIIDSFGGPPRWSLFIVQHMSSGFTEGMVRWLAGATGRDVRLAEDGGSIERGVIYVAPDGGHLELGTQRLKISLTPPLGGHRPAIDRLFESVAQSRLASRTVAALLTGMGADGARGLDSLRRAGAWTIAQDEASSTVYGMPKAAADLEAALEILSLGEIAAYLGSIA